MTPLALKPVILRNGYFYSMSGHGLYTIEWPSVYSGKLDTHEVPGEFVTGCILMDWEWPSHWMMVEFIKQSWFDIERDSWLARVWRKLWNR